jgi:hypothetical protein
MGNAFWTSGLFRRWRKTKPGPGRFQIDFSARLKVFRDGGWAYLELLLLNQSDVTVWVETATVILKELEANWQTTISIGQAKHEILQNVRPNDTLSLSLAGAIYDAAGRPQGAYSCLVFTNVRYRVGDEWFNKELEAHRVEMTALTVFRLRRPRWYDKKVRSAADPVAPLPQHRER